MQFGKIRWASASKSSSDPHFLSLFIEVATMARLTGREHDTTIKHNVATAKIFFA